MDMRDALLLSRMKYAPLTDMTATCTGFQLQQSVKTGQGHVFTWAGAVKIAIRSVASDTLSTGAANMSGFSSASLLYCATQLWCSNVITSTVLAIPALATHIKEAFQHRPANNLKWDLSLTCDKQVHVLPVARWDVQLPGARCSRLTLAYQEVQSAAVLLW